MASLVVIAFLWNTPLVLPLKWLVVLFHELSHAIAAWCTGGTVLSLNVTHREGGMCIVAGGNRTLTLLAGYPGSLCWGVAAIFAARSERFSHVALTGVGLLLVFVALFWVRPFVGFGFPFAIVAGGALAAVGLRASARYRRFCLLLIGSTSCAYAPFDIQQDVFGGHAFISDATLLAEHTWIPFWVWGVLWYGLSAFILTLAFRRIIRSEDPS